MRFTKLKIGIKKKKVTPRNKRLYVTMERTVEKFKKMDFFILYQPLREEYRIQWFRTLHFIKGFHCTNLQCVTIMYIHINIWETKLIIFVSGVLHNKNYFISSLCLLQGT